MTASVAPLYYTTRAETFFDEAQNRSYIILGFTEDREKIDSISFAIGVSLSVSSFVAVAVCTAILVVSLKKAAKWRESTQASIGAPKKEKEAKIDVEGEMSSGIDTSMTSVATVSGDVSSKDVISAKKSAHASNGEKKKPKIVSDKNKRAGKMVSLISIIFIVCYLPNTLNQLVMSLEPDYAKNGRYINTNQVFWSVGFVLESFNAAVNIVMYYTMSTRYRETLLEMLPGRCRRALTETGSEK